MKKIFISLLLMITSSSLVLAEVGVDERRGYISFGGGLNVPIGDYAYGGGKDAKKYADKYKIDAYVKPGVHLNLVNFGYLFWENYVGMCASLNGGGNKYDSFDPKDKSNTYGGYMNLMVGPMGSYPVADFFQVDLRPMIGLGLGFIPESDINDEFSIGSGFAYGVGLTFRFNLASRFALHINADWLNSNCSGVGFDASDDDDFGGFNLDNKFKVSTFTVGLSLAIRLGH